MEWWRAAADAPRRMLTHLNARHPWSHNDHFHRWVLAQLPTHRRSALDVGCGRGELLATLSPVIESVHGNDADPAMSAAAADHCDHLSNVTVHGGQWTSIAGPFDVVTMIAVLHHLELRPTLEHVRTVLRPGGRFLAVGLALPRSTMDYAWELASTVTNPVIGFVKHPRPAAPAPTPAPYPIVDPTMSFAEIRHELETVMPGAQMRHRLGFRHTIAWTAPA